MESELCRGTGQKAAAEAGGRNHHGNQRVTEANGNITLCIAAPF